MEKRHVFYRALKDVFCMQSVNSYQFCGPCLLIMYLIDIIQLATLFSGYIIL